MRLLIVVSVLLYPAIPGSQTPRGLNIVDLIVNHLRGAEMASYLPDNSASRPFTVTHTSVTRRLQRLQGQSESTTRLAKFANRSSVVTCRGNCVVNDDGIVLLIRSMEQDGDELRIGVTPEFNHVDGLAAEGVAVIYSFKRAQGGWTIAGYTLLMD